MKNEPGKLIFIIDDDRSWTTLLTGVLADLGYTHVIVFSSGTDCINELYRKPFVIFLNHRVNDMDGLELLQIINKHQTGSKVIFCTGYKSLSVAVKAIKSGAFDCLVKSDSINGVMASMIKDMADASAFTATV